MGTTLRLKDGKREFIGNDRHFSDTVRSYMGDAAADWFNDRIEDAANEVEDAKDTSKEKRHTIEDYVLHRLIPSLAGTAVASKWRQNNPNNIEEWAEDFKAMMEDVYGLDE